MESTLTALPSVGDTTNLTVPIIIGVVAAIVIVVAVVLIIKSRRSR